MQNAKFEMQNEGNMSGNAAVEKSFSFSVRIVNLYKYLTREHKEYVLSKQLLRCSTSIGANIWEAQRGQSKADFISKMSIALIKRSKRDPILAEIVVRNRIFKQDAI